MLFNFKTRRDCSVGVRIAVSRLMPPLAEFPKLTINAGRWSRTNVGTRSTLIRCGISFRAEDDSSGFSVATVAK